MTKEITERVVAQMTKLVGLKVNRGRGELAQKGQGARSAQQTCTITDASRSEA